MKIQRGLIGLAAWSILSCAFLPATPAWAAGKSKASTADIEEMKRLQDSNSKILADVVQSLNSVHQEVQTMKGSLEESKHFYESETQKNDKILKDFDLRLTTMEEKLNLFEAQMQDFFNKGSATPAGGKKNQPTLSENEETLYKKALAEINAQNFKGAIPLFDDFLKKFPKSNVADNAQYWKGEALYGLKQFPESILEFQKVIKKFPKSDKVPASILKQGYAFYESKAYEDAKAFLEKVTKEYPKSPEAAKAKEKIQQIQTMAKPR